MLRRLFGGGQAKPLVYWEIPPSGYLEVAGVGHHKDNLARLLRRTEEALIEDRPATLVRDPHNRFDPNAVEVRIDDRLVGYLPRELAPAWGTRIATEEAAGRGVRAVAHVWHRWGRAWPEPTVYINLRIPDSPSALEAEAARAHAREERAIQQAAEAAQRSAERAAEERLLLERAEREGQEASWRAAGLCAGCGRPIEHPAGQRGRPPVWCAACRAAGKGGRAL